MAEVVAISAGPPSESQKMDRLLGEAFPILVDPDLQVIGAYRMEHEMGDTTVGNMGYVIVDRKGDVREMVVDPSFGQHADAIVQSLKKLQ